MTYLDVCKTWIGTPFKHQQKVKGMGCDCFGLFRGTYEEYTGEVTKQPIKYSESWVDVGTEDYLKNYLDELLEPTDSVESGCILLFNLMGVNKHIGIVLDEKNFLHSISPHGVVEAKLTDRWLGRVSFKYRLKDG